MSQAEQEAGPMQRLKGKVILVAVAGRIGGVLARRYAAEGACITGQVISIDGGTIMRA